MTTQNLLDTLRQGSAITPKLVRKIITALERALSTEAALHQVVIEHQQLQSRIRGKVMFTSEECAYLEDAMQLLAEMQAAAAPAHPACKTTPPNPPNPPCQGGVVGPTNNHTPTEVA